MPSRRRLTPQARRDDLLDVAEQLFAAAPYDEVRMDVVARQAGVSRALLYSHFATKRELFAAIYRRAADRLLVATELNASVPLAQQVSAGLDAHIDYFVANRHTVIAANRNLAGDPGIQTIIADELDVLRERLVDAFDVDPKRREVLSSVLMSWLVFVRVLCVDWLEHDMTSRDDIRDICVGSLLGSLGPILTKGPTDG